VSGKPTPHDWACSQLRLMAGQVAWTSRTNHCCIAELGRLTLSLSWRSTSQVTPHLTFIPLSRALTSCIDMEEDEVEDCVNPRCGSGRGAQLAADLDWLRRGLDAQGGRRSRLTKCYNIHIHQSKCRAFCWALREALGFECAICSGFFLCICFCGCLCISLCLCTCL